MKWPDWIETNKPAFFAFLIGLGMFLYSGWPAFRADGTAYANTALTVTDPTLQSVTLCNQTFTRPTDGSALQADTTCLKAGDYAVQATRGSQAEPVTIHVKILARGLWGGLAGGGVLLMILAAPGILFRSTNVKVQGTNQPIRGWAYLLTEPDGLSLSRFQLVVWFVPALVIFGILSWPVHQFPTVTDTLWQLLGLSSATAALGIAATPRSDSADDTDKTAAPSGSGGSGQVAPAKPRIDIVLAQSELDALQQALGRVSAALQPMSGIIGGELPPATDPQALAAYLATAQTNFASLQKQLSEGVNQAAARAVEMKAVLAAPSDMVYVARPQPRDLVEDFQGFGDVSRYQYLLLCLGGALTFLVSFLQTWQIPNLPSQMLALVAGSQATYLVVKGIKTMQN